MQQHHRGCTEPDHYPPGPRHSEVVRSILDGVTLGATHRVESHDPTVVKGDHGVEKEVHVVTGWVLVQMHITDWTKAQREDSVLSVILDWLEASQKLI